MALERAAVDEDGARYAVTVYAPGGLRFDGECTLGAGDATLRFDREPPAWTRTFLERLTKSLAKKHAADGAWPRKITRWRAP